MSNNVTRQDLYEITHKELGISKNECIKFVDLIFEYILQNFEQNNKVKISLFGSFDVKEKKLELEETQKQKRKKKYQAEKWLLLSLQNFYQKK